MHLNDIHQDAIKESMNIGIGKAASVLSNLIDHPIDIPLPRISFTKIETMRNLFDTHYQNWSSCVEMEFSGEFEGDSILIFNKQSAYRWTQIISQAQFGSVEEVVPEMEKDLLLEVGNIIINSCIGSISNLLDTVVNYQLPVFFTHVGSGLFDDLLERNRSLDFGIIINSNFVFAAEEISMDLVVTVQKSSIEYVLNQLLSLA